LANQGTIRRMSHVQFACFIHLLFQQIKP
jgi:hypothetical protein